MAERTAVLVVGEALIDAVVKGGEITDQGKHEELLARSPDYRRIFAVYE